LSISAYRPCQVRVVVSKSADQLGLTGGDAG
jgi:hypothetical protein